MSAKTTADLFRERGWGVGTKVELEGDNDGPFDVTAIGRRHILAVGPDGTEWAFECTTGGWSLYCPTPPVPTAEEWRTLYWLVQEWRGSLMHAPHNYDPPVSALMLAADCLKAKVQP